MRELGDFLCAFRETGGRWESTSLSFPALPDLEDSPRMVLVFSALRLQPWRDSMQKTKATKLEARKYTNVILMRASHWALSSSEPLRASNFRSACSQCRDDSACCLVGVRAQSLKILEMSASTDKLCCQVVSLCTTSTRRGCHNICSFQDPQCKQLMEVAR